VARARAITVDNGGVSVIKIAATEAAVAVAVVQYQRRRIW
jgi:hypothetical protein